MGCFGSVIMADFTIIIPTYNERENIDSTLKHITGVFDKYRLDGEILVADDDSPDGTADIVGGFSDPRVSIFRRVSQDKGLSQSVIDAVGRTTTPYVMVMDADGSHQYDAIFMLYREIKKTGNDIVIGSRHVDGGHIEGWGPKRYLISAGANALARIFFPHVKDPGSGFFVMKREVVENAPLKPRGYKLLIEILGKGNWQRVSEIPYVFVDRTAGKSKMRVSLILTYLIQLQDILLHAIVNENAHAHKEMVYAIKFAIVGITGIFVNMAILYFLVENNLFYLLASPIAIECAILSNFTLNEVWTFKDHAGNISRKLASFHAVSIGGMVINILILMLLTSVGVYYLLANLVGIFIGYVWNFMVNRRTTWS